MKLRFTFPYQFLLALIFSSSAILFCGFGNSNTSSAKPAESPALIFVEAPHYLPLAALKGEERFPEGAQIYTLAAPAKTPSQVVTGFFAAADPSLSFDAKTLLFSGKRTASDHWQLYEWSFATKTARAIFAASASDEIRPLALPRNRVAYARRSATGFKLEAAELDGSHVMSLSAIPASALPVDVLADGRILFESNYPLGAGVTPELFLVYSDGSGVESYRCDHPGKRGDASAESDASSAAGRFGGHQRADGDVLFTHGDSLARFTSPLKEEAALDAPKLSYSDGPIEIDASTWLVSSASATQQRFALSLLNTKTKAQHVLAADAANDLVEPIVYAPHSAPHHHPTGLHNWDYANYLALDVRMTRDAALGGVPVTVKLETVDEQGKVISLGTAPIEPDGSFFVQTTGNIPVRFSLLDKDGKTLRAERGWKWIAKGEQRICVGCHTGPEQASENKVPGVLLRSTTPVNLQLNATAPATSSAAKGEK